MLRITKQTDYGILLLTYFISESDEAPAYSARDLARQTLLPLPMVSKILKLLTRNQILTSQRGVKGGYTLALPPEQIPVSRVIGALDGPIALTECQDDTRNCGQESSCPVRTNWEIINRSIHQVLESISLADMNRPLRGGAVDIETLHRLGRPAQKKAVGCCATAVQADPESLRDGA